jgi:hypothetical protein
MQDKQDKDKKNSEPGYVYIGDLKNCLTNIDQRDFSKIFRVSYHPIDLIFHTNYPISVPHVRT